MATKTPAWQKAYLNQYQPATPTPKPFQIGSQPQPQYTPPAGMQEAAKSFQPMLGAQQPAVQPAVDTSWVDKLNSYSTDPNAARTEYQRANQVFNAKTAIGDTEGAAAAEKYRGQVQTASGGMAAPKPTDGLEEYMKKYMDSVNKPVTPFNYDAQSDPAYQAALRTAQTNSQQAAGNIAADMNKRGLLNSTITADRGNQAAQAEYSRVSDTILPQLRNQAYGEYKDVINQERNKNTDLMNYVTTKYGMNQDDITNKRTDNQNAFTNDLATKQAARLDASDKRQIQQDHLDLADKVSKDYGIHIDPKDDPALVYEQVKGLKTIAQQKQEADGQAAIRKQAQEQFETIGTATPEIAEILGIPVGTTTQQAAYQKGQLGIQQQSANNATARANSSGSTKKPTATEVSRGFEGDITNELAYFDNQADTEGWLNANKGAITAELGTAGYERIKKSALSQYESGNDAASKDSKNNDAKRKSALSSAQNDPRWGKDSAKNNALIKEYENYLTGQ